MTGAEARTLLVVGTASHVGKSTVAAGLCRLLADRGMDVTPFKAQNMSNNARAVPGGEIGVSQFVQARAARVPPSTDTNPVLLKPTGDGRSQLVLDGEAVGHFEARGYYDEHWGDALATAREAHARLVAAHDVVVAEGAGSVAEINLQHRDLANVETARFADARMLLVADIERGGVFASVVGTLELLPDDLRERVAGVCVTKFRGDRSLLDPGIEELEARTGVPVLGVLPYDDPGLPEEDSVSLPAEGERAVRGRDDIPDERAVTVAVVRLPHISNATDFGPLERAPGVRVAYVPPGDPLADADAVVLPGTKNTVADLLAARKAGLGDRLRDFEGPVVGLCGGYQMLGETVRDEGHESGTDRAVLEGLGLLPVETRFEADKRVRQVTRELRPVPVLSGATGTVEGYEIHMGRTAVRADSVARPFDGAGAATDRVLGTYLHDLFANEAARAGFLDRVFASAGLAGERPPAGDSDLDLDPCDRAARLVGDHLDVDALL